MPWKSDGITYEYFSPVKLDIVKDNLEFLENKSGTERAKFLQKYFLFDRLEEPVYAINSFKEGAFLQLFDIVKRNAQLDNLAFVRANLKEASVLNLCYIPPNMRDIDLARFRLYDDRIKDLENRLKTLENALVDVSNKIFTNRRIGLFDGSGGDAD